MHPPAVAVLDIQTIFPYGVTLTTVAISPMAQSTMIPITTFLPAWTLVIRRFQITQTVFVRWIGWMLVAEGKIVLELFHFLIFAIFIFFILFVLSNTSDTSFHLWQTSMIFNAVYIMTDLHILSVISWVISIQQRISGFSPRLIVCMYYWLSNRPLIPGSRYCISVYDIDLISTHCNIEYWEECVWVNCEMPHACEKQDVQVWLYSSVSSWYLRS